MDTLNIENYLKMSKNQFYSIKFHTNPNFILRDVADEHVLIAIGKSDLFDNAIISLNETSSFLWNLFYNATSIQEAINKSLEEYDEAEKVIEYGVVNFVLENLKYDLLQEEN